MLHRLHHFHQLSFPSPVPCIFPAATSSAQITPSSADYLTRSRWPRTLDGVSPNPYQRFITALIYTLCTFHTAVHTTGT
ncbi:hypothetical protein P280DRAFT_279092 [Massarina eburnea CBS 473.64]|uniref:Uncharacterized protein n=1 Tax=Massarina eburnea CBS 473.64 TaxID=1395130 RepID=A0A6A6RGG9_9PLEO|nr:hypothetical protein P280DRAFT_279092 [Massarina eburnea CBS 473.64]